MIKNHTCSTVPEIRKIVSPKFCKNLAQQTGFVKRSTSRLKGYEFANAIIIGSSGDSLLTYTQRITQFNPTCKLSLPGLAQRINTESAEKLMLGILARCLTSVYERGITPIKNISRILIQDSTCISLNKNLANIYSGSGGHHQTAGVKIDCIYDYTNEIVLHVEHHARTVTDTQNGERIFKYLRTGDLVLRDLGYFKIKELENLDESLAYFISRLRVDVKVYLKPSDKDPVNFITFLKKKLKNRLFLDEIVYVGTRKIKSRLIVNKLPDEVINQKLRKAKRGAQVSRTKLSDAKKALLSYTILITNLPRERASTSEIMILYRIRWRIELLFKEWKSQIKIENILGTNIHRINCLIYGRLCLILIMNKLTAYLSIRCLGLYNRELSVKKALDILIKDGVLLIVFLNKGMRKKLKKIEKDLHLLLKNKYRSRKTTRELILCNNTVA